MCTFVNREDPDKMQHFAAFLSGPAMFAKIKTTFLENIYIHTLGTSTHDSLKYYIGNLILIHSISMKKKNKKTKG